jgi:hypothetical protein
LKRGVRRELERECRPPLVRVIWELPQQTGFSLAEPDKVTAIGIEGE